MSKISEPYRIQTVFNANGNAKTTKIFYAPVGGRGLENLDPSVFAAPLGRYNYLKVYELLHKKYPSVINRENPVLLDDSVALTIYTECSLHPYIIIKWLTDYVNTSNYFSLVQLGAKKYNLHGQYSSYVIGSDIKYYNTLKELYGQSFADPTYDHTFKMIFANDAHKNLLITFLNACLNLTGEEQITGVRILNNDHIPAGIYGIRSAVDILCTNSNGEKIVMEMQRKFEHYFLPRSQYYMSRLVAGQVQDGDSSTYDIKECWIISIGKTDFFKPNIHGTPRDLPYEIWSRPTIEIPGQNGEGPKSITTPQNIMNWKFFSLEKFRKMCENGDIVVTKDSCLKEQFMEFLINCPSMQKTPDDRHEIIKEAYEVMKVANFTPSDYLKLQEEKAEEFFARLEARAQEKIKEKELAEELAKGIEQGKLKGEIKGEISKIKGFLDFGASQEQIIPKLKFLTHDKVKDKIDENLKYIEDHLASSDSDICDELGLVGDLLES